MIKWLLSHKEFKSFCIIGIALVVSIVSLAISGHASHRIMLYSESEIVLASISANIKALQSKAILSRIPESKESIEAGVLHGMSSITSFVSLISDKFKSEGFMVHYRIGRVFSVPGDHQIQSIEIIFDLTDVVHDRKAFFRFHDAIMSSMFPDLVKNIKAYIENVQFYAPHGIKKITVSIQIPYVIGQQA